MSCSSLYSVEPVEKQSFMAFMIVWFPHLIPLLFILIAFVGSFGKILINFFRDRFFFFPLNSVNFFCLFKAVSTLLVWLLPQSFQLGSQLT